MKIQIVVDGVELTVAAADFVRECGVDVESDLRQLLAGRSTRETLLTGSLDGADDDRVEGIREYVSAVCAVAGR
jgi:hypothetical protein